MKHGEQQKDVLGVKMYADSDSTAGTIRLENAHSMVIELVNG